LFVPAAKVLILQFGTEEFALFLGNVLYYVSSTSQSKVLEVLELMDLRPAYAGLESVMLFFEMVRTLRMKNVGINPIAWLWS
jgi:hypothetical protein